MSQKIDLSQIRFLLIDPNSISMELTRDVLFMMGARTVRSCANTDRALEALRADLYDIVVMEWNTTPMSGLQFIDYIRTSPVSPNRLMPILLMTARSEEEFVMQARDRGITEFHFYTLNRADLVYAICHLLGLRPVPTEVSKVEAAQ